MNDEFYAYVGSFKSKQIFSCETVKFLKFDIWWGTMKRLGANISFKKFLRAEV